MQNNNVSQAKLKKRFSLGIIAIPIIGLVLLGQYLFAPYSSSLYNFKLDDKAIEKKNEFLTSQYPVDSTARRPNIIILVADDLGKTDISLYGNTTVATPNIDSLAAEGVKFTEGYVTAAICSPSRAGLLTGRYQQRFGHELQPAARYPKNNFERIMANWFIDRQQLEFSENTNIPTQESIAEQGLPLQEITIADVLKKQGYATGIIGKWHLGASKLHTPLRRGFDYHYGFYQAFSWYTDTTNNDFVNVRHRGIMDSHVWDHGHEGEALIRRGDEIIDEKKYLTHKLAEEASDFIDRNKDKPFLLYVPFNAPHTPFQALKTDVAKWEAKGIDRNHAVYYSMIQYLDEAVGAINNKVKSLGLEENTLIFFLSDNGGATYTEATTNSPLKGGKLSLYEGGINVPFVAKWKGQIPHGTVYKKPVSSLDIFATAVSITKSKLPDSLIYDGVNLLPYLLNKEGEQPHPVLCWRAGANKAIRKGDWKLVVNNTDKFTVLYDLKSDKEEKTNLAGKFPEKVKELEAALSAWEKELVKPLWPSTGFYRNEFNGVTDRYTL